MNLTAQTFESTFADMAKGMEKGRDEERREAAAKLKELGAATSIISRATGLSLEEVENL